MRHIVLNKKGITFIIVASLIAIALIRPIKASSSTINFQGKMVNLNGTNITSGSPACAVAGASNDTCDIRASIYSASSGGTLLWQETYSNYELESNSGIFNLNLNSICNNWTIPTSPCSGIGIDWATNPAAYLQIDIDTDGNGSFTSGGGQTMETFNRKELESTAVSQYSLNSENLGGINASNFIQLSPGSIQTITSATNSLINLNENATGSPNLIQLQVGGSNKFIVTNAGQVQISTQGSSGGIVIGGDTSVYRSATDELTIGNSLKVGGNLLSSTDNLHVIGSGNIRISSIVTGSAGVEIYNTPTATGVGSDYTVAINKIDTKSPFLKDTNKTLSTGLNGYWNLNEGSGTRADSAGSNNLSLVGNVLTTVGKQEIGGLFPGVSNYLSLSDNPSISVGNFDFTFSGWINLAAKGASRSFIDKASDGVNREYLLEYQNSADRFSFAIYDGALGQYGRVQANNLGSPSTDTWYFVTAWYDSTAATLNMQINNGTTDSSSVTHIPVDTAYPFSIGGIVSAWNGKIDEVGFWKKVLSAQERSDLYNGGAGNTCIGSCTTTQTGSYEISTTNVGTATGGAISLKSGIGSGNGSNSAINIVANSDLGSSDAVLKVGDGGGTMITVLGNGNVGIGVSNPSNILSIGGDNTISNESGNIKIDSTGGSTEFSNDNITSFTQMLVGDGTTANNAFSFIGDPNSGLYRVGNDNLGLTINGTTGLNVDSSGNISIGYGTATSNRLLRINGAIRLSSTSTPSTPGGGDIYNNGTTLFFYDGTAAGWVSLGSTGTSSLFTDAGAVTYLTSTIDALAIGGSSSSAPFYFDTGATRLTLTNTSSGNSFVVNDTASDSTPFVIDKNGNVGIGTSNTSSGGFAVDTSGTLTKGLESYWKLEESGGSRIDSKGDNELTDKNTVTNAVGKINTAGQFTKANTEYLSIADNASLSTGDIDFSISTWVYMDSKPAADHMMIVSKSDTSTSKSEYYIWWNFSMDRFLFSAIDQVQLTASSAIANNLGAPALNTWYHIVAWHDAANNQVGIQINNGTPNITTYTNGYIIISDSTASFMIGAFGDTPTYPWNGRIDEVGFWKKVLSAQERTDLYNSGNGDKYTSNNFALTVNGNIGPDSSPSSASASNITTTLVTSNDQSQHSSIEIGSDGLPIISHWDATTTDLVVTHCSNSSCSSNTSVTFPSANNQGELYTDIAIGTDDLPIISYADRTSTDLMITHCGNLDCSSGNVTTQITSANNQGTYSAIQIGTDGLPIIAHHDSTTSTLVITHCGSIDCSSGNITTSVAGGDKGYYNSMVIGLDGLPIIASYEYGSVDLAVTHCSNVLCTSSTTATVTSGDYIGLVPSIAIGSDKLPVISHFNYTSGALWVTHCGNDLCSSGNVNTSVTSAGSSYSQSSLHIGVDGLPLIAFYKHSVTDVVVVHCGNVTCASGNTITTITNAGTIGDGASLTIGIDGLPIMSYGYTTGTDLMVTKCATIDCSQSSGTYYSGGSDIGSASSYFKNVYATTYYGKNFSVSNFDVAEEYEAVDESIEAGDVVKLSNPTEECKENCIEKTTKEYEEGSIGVISTEPGLYLRNWEENSKSRPVGLAGRVPVKISDENGSIEIGDYLTTSSTPGYAMKATEGGMIIGRAMEEFKEEGDSEMVEEELSKQKEAGEEALKKTEEETEISEETKENIQELIEEVTEIGNTSNDQPEAGKPDPTNKEEESSGSTNSNEQAPRNDIKYGRIMMYINLGYVGEEKYTKGGIDVKRIEIENGTQLFDVIEGRLKINTGIEVEGEVSAEKYTALKGSDVVISLQENKGLKVIDNGENEVFSIDSKGKIKIREGVGSSIGSAVIPAGETSITVNDPSITSKSQIFPTPSSAVKVIVEKVENNQGFTIVIQEPLTIDLKVDYLIIN